MSKYILNQKLNKAQKHLSSLKEIKTSILLDTEKGAIDNINEVDSLINYIYNKIDSLQKQILLSTHE